jgi:hypothetical protein
METLGTRSSYPATALAGGGAWLGLLGLKSKLRRSVDVARALWGGFPGSDLLSLVSPATKSGDDVVDFTGGDGERTVTHGSGDINSNHFALKSYERGSGVPGFDDLIVIESIGEAVLTIAEWTATSTER